MNMNIEKVPDLTRKKLLKKALLRFLPAIAFLGVLVFVPAGTLKFINGWLFMAGLLIPMMFTLIYLIVKDPELLEKRMRMKEKETAQKQYLKLSIILVVVAYTIPGLDFRYHWSQVPGWLVVVALAFMILGYVLFLAVMVQNRYASRVIEIQDNQKLIDTGLYRFVRHPMYLAATILYVASVLVLGSFYALIPMLFLPLLLAYRIRNEEKVLKNGLPGYKEYTARVKYRLIPFVW